MTSVREDVYYMLTERSLATGIHVGGRIPTVLSGATPATRVTPRTEATCSQSLLLGMLQLSPEGVDQGIMTVTVLLPFV